MRRGTFVDEPHEPRAGRPDVKDAPRRVLVTRLKRIGDAILTLSVVEAIRESFPACAIDFLAEEEPAQAAIGHPAVDRVLALDRAYAAWMPASPSLLWKLRARRYDWVLDLYGNPRSALLSAWTGGPGRGGSGETDRGGVTAGRGRAGPGRASAPRLLGRDRGAGCARHGGWEPASRRTRASRPHHRHPRTHRA